MLYHHPSGIHEYSSGANGMQGQNSTQGYLIHYDYAHLASQHYQNQLMQEEMMKQALYQELLLDHNHHMLHINLADNPKAAGPMYI